ncbi:hypothetical protein C2845_PM10G20600 [Panicum miliaceum]|uniref:RNA polymerase II transcription factor B subunit 2 n=1 Tax=Panicum miliaceum TaxID=4540 RepID=A0A3L6PDQ3_PANMI|nr:hypothetical protein C2845_PM10G20600 [Panicum miliaceum]
MITNSSFPETLNPILIRPLPQQHAAAAAGQLVSPLTLSQSPSVARPRSDRARREPRARSQRGPEGTPGAPSFLLRPLVALSRPAEDPGRSLPPLAKKYALQMLYVLAPVTAAAMEEWVLNEYAAKHRVSIDKLLQLRVFVEVRDSTAKHAGAWQIRPFLTLMVFLCIQMKGGELQDESKVPRDGEAPKLTENGFQFLLMETSAQLWYIMREYISSAEERGVDPTELISFLLELSFHKLGAAYSLNTLTDVQRVAIRDLAELGLVKLHLGRKDSWFIPTQLATNLSASLSDSSSSKEGFVVVETDFRIALVHMALCCLALLPCSIDDKKELFLASYSDLFEVPRSETENLFRMSPAGRVEYQLPKLIVGAITKESIYGAFENGITAEQIISFLKKNAHPRVADKIPTVPENVTDQIRLWETDRNRVEMIPSHLYEDFPSKEWFEQCCDHARDHGYLLWEDSRRMRLIVRGEFHPEMREFLRRQR